MNDPLSKEQLHGLRYRGVRPSQYTSATIKQDYSDMLGEIQRLRAELGQAEELSAYRHGQIEELRAELDENVGVMQALRRQRGQAEAERDAARAQVAAARAFADELATSAVPTQIAALIADGLCARLDIADPTT